jgi:hypothetical protein
MRQGVGRHGFALLAQFGPGDLPIVVTVQTEDKVQIP